MTANNQSLSGESQVTNRMHTKWSRLLCYLFFPVSSHGANTEISCFISFQHHGQDIAVWSHSDVKDHIFCNSIGCFATGLGGYGSMSLYDH